MKKTGRNDKCHCGSNKKYKKCCLHKDIRKKLELEKAEKISIFNVFSVIPDPRDNRGKKNKLIDLLIMALYGILNGYDVSVK